MTSEVNKNNLQDKHGLTRHTRRGMNGAAHWAVPQTVAGLLHEARLL